MEYSYFPFGGPLLTGGAGYISRSEEAPGRSAGLDQIGFYRIFLSDGKTLENVRKPGPPGPPVYSLLVTLFDY